MPRGEVPPEGIDITALGAYLKRKEFEEAKEQDLAEVGSTKDFSFAQTARELQLPQEHWDQPVVRDFVQVHNDLLQLRHDIPRVARSAVPDSKRRIACGALDGELDLGRHLEDRYLAVDELVRASFQILGEGMPGVVPGHNRQLNVSTVSASVSAALKRYGLTVVAAVRH